MSDQNCTIIGASHAAAQLAVSLRQNGWQGRINLIGDEPFLPYQRPPLSKDFLANKKDLEDILIRKPNSYEQANIHFTLGVKAEAIDRKQKTVHLDNGESMNYDKLALTLGARARKVPIDGSDLSGILYLRTLSDVELIKTFVGANKKAVIVGGGYIGLETAAALKQLGMEVTVLEMMPRVLQRVTAPELSKFYTRVHTEEGVQIVTDVTVSGFQGKQSVERVACSDGSSYDADLVIVGVGVIPNTELAETAGLEVDNGIVVDEFSRASDPDIVAAGDCTNHFNPIYQRKLRLESVQNAVDQAKVAAATLCGELKEYSVLPWFWSDQYDMKLQIAGLSQGYDETIVRGDASSGRELAVFYLKEGKIISVDAVNKPKEFMIGKRLITEQTLVDPAKLADQQIPINELI